MSYFHLSWSLLARLQQSELSRPVAVTDTLPCVFNTSYIRRTHDWFLQEFNSSGSPWQMADVAAAACMDKVGNLIILLWIGLEKKGSLRNRYFPEMTPGCCNKQHVVQALFHGAQSSHDPCTLSRFQTKKKAFKHFPTGSVKLRNTARFKVGQWHWEQAISVN